MTMLNLAYGVDVPAPLLEIMEHHARRLGLPLSQVELLGQDTETVEGFLLAIERGAARSYASSLGRPSVETERGGAATA
ncbi:MAG TPA: hypothetical protein VM681_00845 [Candidatus Thermoplasmatota archaeon]|nr:hypothetical protein [Candidatus Thermoplasmatota archaeon]